MTNRVCVGAILGALTFAAQASAIRIEFETNITTAYDYAAKAVVPVKPISGNFAVEFDDAHHGWERDEWGPYYFFDMDWIATPATSRIPFSSYFEVEPGAQQFINTYMKGSGGYVDVGTVPLPGYGVGYNQQGFGFHQTVMKTGMGSAGRENSMYELFISLGRITPVESFKPLSTLGFLQSFVGQDISGGTAELYEGYQLNHTGDSRLAYGGLRYIDRSIKVTAVTDLSAEVPEPATLALMLAGLAMAGGISRRKAVTMPRRR